MMNNKNVPITLVDGLEQGLKLPSGNTERFSGYGVMGLTFDSGHVLGLRRFPASTVGPGYTSVWHRNPLGQWTFYQNVQPQQACTRYFGSAISTALMCAISIEWTGDYSFTVTIEKEVDLRWQVFLTATPATRLMNALGHMLPEVLWHNKAFLKGMGGIASLMLAAGHIGLTGTAPNGQSFVANPRQIWLINASTASLQGQSFGNIGPLRNQARLQDFWIPQRGIFAIGGADFERYDPAKHTLATSFQ